MEQTLITLKPLGNPDGVLGIAYKKLLKNNPNITSRSTGSLGDFFTLSPEKAHLEEFKIVTHKTTSDGDVYEATTLFPIIVNNKINNTKLMYKIGTKVKIMIFPDFGEPKATLIDNPEAYDIAENRKKQNRKSRKTRKMRKTRKSRRV